MKNVQNEGLEKELLALIIDACNITEPVPEDFSRDDPLIGSESPLGLDSLDAVEIIVTIEKTYHVKIGSQEVSRKILKSLKTLTDFVRKNTKPA